MSTYQSYSDHPAVLDELGFTPSVNALLDIIHESELEDTPLTIGIYGPWGSGKTSLMRMLQAGLKPDDPETRFVPVWFEAWRYAQSDALWRALLVSVVEQIRAYLLDDEARLRAIMSRKDKQINQPPDAQAVTDTRASLNRTLDDLIGSLYRSIEREEAGAIEMDWPAAGKLTTRLAIRAGFAFVPLLQPLTTFVEAAQGKIGEGEDLAELWDLFHRRRTQIYRDHIRALDQFQQHLRTLIAEWISARGRRLVIFIDDLDRCLPEQAVSVLEAIKIFLDIPGCLFVLGVDREIIERGILVRYKEFALDAAAAERVGQAAALFPVGERAYLEKIVQVPFELPPLDEAAIRRFLAQRLTGMARGTLPLPAEEVEPIATVMTRGLQRNPRKLKRTFNTFRLLRALSHGQQRSVPAVLLAKLVVIQSSFFAVYEAVVRRPTLLKELEQVARDLPGQTISEATRQLVEGHPRLDAMLYERPYFADLSDDDLNNLVFLTHTTRDSGQ
jgi:energy-coupling factor transporter ATP-binding protein EcfA2